MSDERYKRANFAKACELAFGRAGDMIAEGPKGVTCNCTFKHAFAAWTVTLTTSDGRSIVVLSPDIDPTDEAEMEKWTRLADEAMEAARAVRN